MSDVIEMHGERWVRESWYYQRVQEHAALQTKYEEAEQEHAVLAEAHKNTLKFFEVRDSATYIPVVAFRPGDMLQGQGRLSLLTRMLTYALGRSGWDLRPKEYSPVIMLRLDNVEAHSCEYDWKSRTLFQAHAHIKKHWNELPSGHVVCTEFLRGERSTPKTTESMP